MKKLILFLLFTNCIFSQEVPSENYIWFYNHVSENGIEAIIGVKNCYIREESSTNSTLKDSLQIGTKIKVIKNTEDYLNIKGLNLSWVEIEYHKNNEIKTGYLWKGFIALGSTTKGNTTFLTSIDSKYTKKVKNEYGEFDAEFYKISIKAINSDNQIIGEKSFSNELNESLYFENSVVGSWGLKDLKNIYRISFSGQACGIPTLHYYFGWNGNSFLNLPIKYDVGDAGAYYHNEEFIFPKEKGGQPNTIIKNITEAENTDDSLESYSFLVKKSIEYYSWDGKNYKLIKTKKLKPYIEKEN